MNRARALVLFVPYLAFLFYVTVVDYTPPGPGPDQRLKLVPFRSIAYYGNRGGWPMAVNLVGNLAVFVPLGLLLPSLSRHRGATTAAQALLAGAGLSLAIELIQYAERRRVADVDDVILNAAGSVLGYATYRALRWLSRRRRVLAEGSRAEGPQNDRPSSCSIACRSSSGMG